MLRHRTLYISGKKTSIALERIFWDAIDRISEGDWKDWVTSALESKRSDIGRASYLRTQLLIKLVECH